MAALTQRQPDTRSRRMVRITLRTLYPPRKTIHPLYRSCVGLGAGLNGRKVSVYAQAV